LRVRSDKKEKRWVIWVPLFRGGVTTFFETLYTKLRREGGSLSFGLPLFGSNHSAYILS
jgi:hypothetical protein